MKVELSNFGKGMKETFDENVCPSPYAITTKNFDFGNGLLKDGYGISESKCFTEEIFGSLYDRLLGKIRWIGHYPYIYNISLKNGHVLICDSAVYVSKDAGKPFVLVYDSEQELDFIDANACKFGGEHVFLISFAAKVIIVNIDKSTGEPKAIVVPTEKSIKSICSYCGWYFFIDNVTPCTVNYMRNINMGEDIAVQLDNAAWVNMSENWGALQKITHMNGLLYLFCEQGIIKADIGDGSDFKFLTTSIFATTGRIFERSVQICGDKIVFATNEGLYVFDEKDSVNVHHALCSKCIFDDCTSVFIGGKYYISCKYDSENAVLVYDLLDDIYQIAVLGFKLTLAKIVTGANSRVCATIDEMSEIFELSKCGTTIDRNEKFIDKNSRGDIDINGEKRYFGDIDLNGKKRYFVVPTKKSWETSQTDLGHPERMKFLKSLTMTVNVRTWVFVRCDNKELRIDFFASPQPQTLRLGISCWRVGIEICTEEVTTRISRPILDYTVLGGK